jgi:hypothetical protein
VLGWLSWSLLVGVGCKKAPPDAPSAEGSAAARPSAPLAPSASPSAARPLPSSSSSPPAQLALAFIDGGSCKPLAKPTALPLRSPSTLALRGADLLVLQNDDGRPRATTLSASAAAGGKGSGSGATEMPGQWGYVVPCALAESQVFCPDRAGGVHRSGIDGSQDRVVAASRVGTHVAAAPLAIVHTVVGYLASRQTTEGWVSEAWMIVDDDAPVRISEDGSGATSLAFAPRGPTVIALTVDARTALTAMHARTVTFEGRATLGEDVVAFIGGPGDRRTRAALALGDNCPGWSLLPISKDVGQFGLALVRLDDPPRLDEPVQWSLYPNGLDPAPLAAAIGGGHAWVARVRPRSSEPGSARVLEVGVVADSGDFEAHDFLSTTGDPSDVALLVDASGALWVSWVDKAGAWVEHFSC